MSDEKLIQKKDARILWKMITIDGKSYIHKLFVAEFLKNQPETWPMHLYEEYNCDTGNCIVVWDKYWDVGTIAVEFFYFLEYSDTHAKNRALDELCKIKEFYEMMEMRRKGWNKMRGYSDEA